MPPVSIGDLRDHLAAVPGPQRGAEDLHLHGAAVPRRVDLLAESAQVHTAVTQLTAAQQHSLRQRCHPVGQLEAGDPAVLPSPRDPRGREVVPPPLVIGVHDDAHLLGREAFGDVQCLGEGGDDAPVRGVHRVQGLDRQPHPALGRIGRQRPDRVGHPLPRAIERVGMTAESVPEAGQLVFLRSTANLSTGGTATDVTDVIHPDNREMAERAVRAIGLDVGGVDFLSKNITESYRKIGGGICEVNAAPGFRMHVAPSEGTPREVANPVIEMLFPPGAASKVPIAAVTGTNGKTTTARMLAHITKMAGFTPGLTTTDGVYINGQRTVQGDMTGPVSARMVLADPQIDIAVLETARGGLLRAGMGVNEVNVGAVLNVQADHLGLKGIDTLEQLAEVKRVVVEVATDCAVLNADDSLVLKMSGYTEAKNICYVTVNPHHTLVREHIRAGGRACALEAGVNGQMIALYDRGSHIPLLWTHLIPATLEGRAMHNVQNAMFAAAMAFSLGIKLDAIRQGLRTFDSTFFQAPGRMNVFNEHPFKVLFDYGHNAHAVAAMASLAQQLDVAGRRIVVLAGPGDRRDEDLVAIAQAVAGRFDHYICRRDDNLRDRAPDEVPRIMSQALQAAGVPADAISMIPDEQEAIDAALQMGAPGDLLLVFADALVRSWKQITKFRPAGSPPPRAPQFTGSLADEPALGMATPAAGAPGLATTSAPARSNGFAQAARAGAAQPPELGLEGLIRDERGVRLAPEIED